MKNENKLKQPKQFHYMKTNLCNFNVFDQLKSSAIRMFWRANDEREREREW